MKRKTKTPASSRDLRDAAVGTERTGTVERPMERAAEKDAAVTVNHPSNTVTKDVTIATAKICYPPIINECLCFVQAKVDILPRDDLVKVCCDFYSNDDIWHAKQMLFDACAENLKTRGLRLVTRKGPDRTRNNMGDICSALSALTEDEQPSFVAQNLNMLPPLDIQHVDMTVLLQELKYLRKEMTDMASKCNELDALKAEVDQIKKFITKTPSQDLSPQEYPPLVAEPVISTGQQKSMANTQQETSTRETKETTAKFSYAKTLTAAPARRETTTAPKSTVQSNDLQRRKPAVIGRKSTDKIRVNRNRLMKLFVSRLLPDTTEKDMSTYLKEEVGVDAKCIKLKTKFDTYASFKIEINCEPSLDVYSPDIWPKGLLVKRFFENNKSERAI